MLQKGSQLTINLEKLEKIAEKENYQGPIIKFDYEKNEIEIRLKNDPSISSRPR